MIERIKIGTHQENKRDYEEAVAPINEAIKHWHTSVWAKELAATLPTCEFELHIDRWVEGIDAVLYSIKYGTVSKNRFGWYGDISGKNLNGIEQRAFAVERWLQGEQPQNETERNVHALLGPLSDEKKLAAEAYIKITRSYAERGFDEQLSQEWRTRSGNSQLLGKLFQGEGIDRGIDDGGGYWLPHKLDLFLGIIGGTSDYDRLDVEASCNMTLRHVFRDDRERMMAAKGYMWGLSSYLKDVLSVDDMRSEAKECAGYAIKARRCFEISKYDKEERGLIAVRLFLLIRYWYIRAVIFAVKEEMKDDDYEIPTLDFSIVHVPQESKRPFRLLVNTPYD